MRIKIVNIDCSKVIQVGDTALGYKGEFTCPIVSGAAIFVPYSGREECLVPGVSLSVETSQEGVSNFRILSTHSEHSITPLDQAGDYCIIGTVSLNGDNEVFYIDVGDFNFIVDIDESEGIIPQKGDTVEFIIHGLSLWDENI